MESYITCSVTMFTALQTIMIHGLSEKNESVLCKINDLGSTIYHLSDLYRIPRIYLNGPVQFTDRIERELKQKELEQYSDNAHLKITVLNKGEKL